MYSHQDDGASCSSHSSDEYPQADRCRNILAARDLSASLRDGVVSFGQAIEVRRRSPGACQVFALVEKALSSEEWLELEIALAMFGFNGLHVDIDTLDSVAGPSCARRTLLKASRLCEKYAVRLQLG